MIIDGVQTRREYVGRLPEVLEWVNQGARNIPSSFLAWDATPDLAQATWEWPEYAHFARATAKDSTLGRTPWYRSDPLWRWIKEVKGA